MGGQISDIEHHVYDMTEEGTLDVHMISHEAPKGIPMVLDKSELEYLSRHKKQLEDGHQKKIRKLKANKALPDLIPSPMPS